MPARPVVDEDTAPVGLRLVAGRVHPEDARRVGVRRDGVRRAGATAPVAAARIEPAHRVVDDGDAVGLRIGDGLRQLHLGVDADQVELGLGRHLVDDLGDGRAVLGRGCQLAGAVVHRHRRARQVTRRPGCGQTREPEVDDGDPDPGPADAGRVPSARVDRRHPLAGDRFRRMRQRASDSGDARQAAQVVEHGRRHQDLRQAIGLGLDLDTLRLHPLRHRAEVRRLDDKPHAAMANAHPERTRPRERGGRAVPAHRGHDVDHTRVEHRIRGGLRRDRRGLREDAPSRCETGLVRPTRGRGRRRQHRSARRRDRAADGEDPQHGHQGRERAVDASAMRLLRGHVWALSWRDGTGEIGSMTGPAPP